MNIKGGDLVASAHLMISPRGPGLDPNLVLPIPARDVVSTTLHVGAAPSELPTLITVERVIGRLAALGLSLRDLDQANSIAGLVNKRFLPVASELWVDARLEIAVVSVGTSADLQPFLAVSALRPPTLEAANTALIAGPDYAFGHRRANENRLVRGLEESIESNREAWTTYGRPALRYLGSTLMGVLVENLIGVPLTDIIRTTLTGALRTIIQ